MAIKPQPNSYWTQKRWFGGLANFPKEDVQNAFYFAQSIDYRSDAMALTLLPASLKESGSTVTDLVKWMDTTPENLDVYAYGSTGNFYKRTAAGSWSNLYTFANSHGNGLGYYYGDDYVYAACDSTLGRFGPVGSASPTFNSDFLKSQGGTPTNTASLVLASASSQYAHATDSASLSVTGDLTLETFFKANSFPAVGSSMTLMGKWDEATNHRSYKLDLFGVSGFFGTGGDSSRVISVNTTEAPIDSACTGTTGLSTLSATNVSFAIGQVILIHQTQGSGAGQWEKSVINGYTAGTITLQSALLNTYTAGAQVIVMKQYTNVTVNTGVTWSAKAWNGTTGGILAFLCNGTLTVTGNISADICGFRGGVGHTSAAAGQAEGTGGAGGAISTSANGNGGGGGTGGGNGIGTNFRSGGGGGGGNGTVGNNGANGGFGAGGTGGNQIGTTDLTTLSLGGGGGGGGSYNNNSVGGSGGIGGGAIFGFAATITGNGTVTAAGQSGGGGDNLGDDGGGGGGAGGSILLKAQAVTMTSGTVQALGGNGGGQHASGGVGGAGSTGRVTVDYLTSATIGTTTPTATIIQDNTLVTTTTIQARLGISDNGTSAEFLTYNLNNLMTSAWYRLSVTWKASTSTASWYLTGSPLGTSVGTKTSISDNASDYTVGANNGGSGITNYFDGKLNDDRVISNVQTAGQIFANCFLQLSATYAGLQAYYTFNSVYTDTTGNSNTLTAVNTPTFDTADVPYPAATTRLDIDQSYTTTGATYAIKAAISESTGDKLPFTPLFDPQKSVDFNFSAKGTGAVTVTVHDQQNNVVDSITVANAALPASGWYEFIYALPWRIVINKSYHMHVTQPTADGLLVSSTSNNLTTADFHTYYGFLVTDTQFHPIARMLNLVVIGNERYLAIWDGASYNANYIAFPQGTHVRCFGFWREFLCIGVWQENAAGTGNIYDYPTGTVYFWDGISLTFNFWETIAEGQPNALLGIDTSLYIWAGGNGYLTMYQGGYIYASGNSPTTKVKKMPFLGRADNMEVYPQGMAMYRSLIHIGAAANASSNTLKRGVYSWGTLNAMYPESLSFDYPISTGNTGSTVQVGATFAGPGNTLLVSWKDGAAYGVDQVNMNNRPATTGYLQTMILDNERIYHQELSMKVRADHLALNTGETVVVGYQIDRSGVFTTDKSNTIKSSNMVTENDISNGRGREFQYQVTLGSTNGTSPTLLGLSAVTDALPTEEQF